MWANFHNRPITIDVATSETDRELATRERGSSPAPRGGSEPRGLPSEMGPARAGPPTGGVPGRPTEANERGLRRAFRLSIPSIDPPVESTASGDFPLPTQTRQSASDGPGWGWRRRLRGDVRIRSGAAAAGPDRSLGRDLGPCDSARPRSLWQPRPRTVAGFRIMRIQNFGISEALRRGDW
jgi:hypothetical protein